MKKIRNYIILLFSAVFIGLVLLIFVFLLPSNYKNTWYSAYTVSAEAPHFRLGIWQLDNHMDDFILNTAFCKNEDAGLLDRVINVYSINYPDSEYGYTLSRYFDGDDSYIYKPYARYWLGYLIFLKPLLLIFDYSEIRVLNMSLQMLLFGFLCYLLYKYGLRKYIPAYLVTYFFISPIATGFSLQYTCVYYVAVISAIVLLEKNDIIRNNNWLSELFFISGILVSFFDILTYPVFALCFLLLTYIIYELETSDEINVKKQAFKYIEFSFVWCAGYVLMWAAKWIIACLVNRSLNDMDIVLAKLIQRSSSDVYEEKISAFKVIWENIVQYKSEMFVLPIIVCLLVVFYKQKIIFNKKRIAQLFMCAVIALYPFVWYLSFKNHSYIHAWYTCRSLAISVGAGVCGLMQLLTPVDNKNEH